MAGLERPAGLRPVGAQGGQRLLIFGVAGAGKTRLIGTGKDSLIIRPPTDSTASIEPGGDTEEIVIPDHGTMTDILRWCQQGGASEKDWVWLDGISLFEDYGLDEVFADAIAVKPSRAEHGPDKGEYGVNRQRIMKWVRDMVGLSEAGMFNFGITAVPWSIYDPVREDDIWMPMFGPRDGSLSHKLCGYMNVVAYLRVVKSGRRVLYTEAPGFYGKDQISGDGLNEMVSPTMPKIQEALGATSGARKTRRKRSTQPARKKRR